MPQMQRLKGKQARTETDRETKAAVLTAATDMTQRFSAASTLTPPQSGFLSRSHSRSFWNARILTPARLSRKILGKPRNKAEQRRLGRTRRQTA
jgi:hypothetical protein